MLIRPRDIVVKERRLYMFTPKFILTLASIAAFCAGTVSAVTPDAATDRRAVEAIFRAHDLVYENATAPAKSLDAYLEHVADNLVLMPDDGVAVEGKAAYRKVIEDSLPAGRLAMRHEVVAVDSFPELVVVRGRAIGSFTPPGDAVAQRFETKNVFLFRRNEGGKLMVWQIIFNHSPVSSN